MPRSAVFVCEKKRRVEGGWTQRDRKRRIIFLNTLALRYNTVSLNENHTKSGNRRKLFYNEILNRSSDIWKREKNLFRTIQWERGIKTTFAKAEIEKLKFLWTFPTFSKEILKIFSCTNFFFVLEVHNVFTMKFMVLTRGEFLW